MMKNSSMKQNGRRITNQKTHTSTIRLVNAMLAQVVMLVVSVHLILTARGALLTHQMNLVIRKHAAIADPFITGLTTARMLQKALRMLLGVEVEPEDILEDLMPIEVLHHDEELPGSSD